MFLLFQSSVAQSQWCSASCTALLVSRLRVHKKLGRDRTRQKDIPYHVVSCEMMRLGGVDWGWAAPTWGLAGHLSAGGEKWHCASFLLFFLFFLLLFFLLNCFYPNPCILTLTPVSILVPHPTARQYVLLSCWLGSTWTEGVKLRSILGFPPGTAIKSGGFGGEEGDCQLKNKQTTD